MKEEIFSKWRVRGLANKDTMFWIDGSWETKFQIFGRTFQKGGDMF